MRSLILFVSTLIFALLANANIFIRDSYGLVEEENELDLGLDIYQNNNAFLSPVSAHSRLEPRAEEDSPGELEKPGTPRQENREAQTKVIHDGLKVWMQNQHLKQQFEMRRLEQNGIAPIGGKAPNGPATASLRDMRGNVLKLGLLSKGMWDRMQTEAPLLPNKRIGDPSTSPTPAALQLFMENERSKQQAALKEAKDAATSGLRPVKVMVRAVRTASNLANTVVKSGHESLCPR